MSPWYKNRPLDPIDNELDRRWITIQQALVVGDVFTVVDTFRECPRRIKSPMQRRIYDWLADYLALPPTKEFPWPDDQGLQRLIYLTWPKIPVRSFDVEDLPALWQNLEQYDNQYRLGRWLGTVLVKNDADCVAFEPLPNDPPPLSTEVATPQQGSLQGILERLEKSVPKEESDRD